MRIPPTCIEWKNSIFLKLNIPSIRVMKRSSTVLRTIAIIVNYIWSIVESIQKWSLVCKPFVIPIEPLPFACMLEYVCASTISGTFELSWNLQHLEYPWNIYREMPLNSTFRGTIWWLDTPWGSYTRTHTHAFVHNTCVCRVHRTRGLCEQIYPPAGFFIFFS